MRLSQYAFAFTAFLLVACAPPPPPPASSPGGPAPAPPSRPSETVPAQPAETPIPAPADDAKRADGAPCSLASQCQSGICEGEGCTGESGTCADKRRACTMDRRAYCGCDGVTFYGSGSCPGRRYQHRGACNAER